MPSLKICRICLETKAKLYKYDRYQLKDYYQQIMGKKINHKDDLPHYFCYECAAMLYKFHKFREKCCTGQEILKNFVTTKGFLTLKSVENIDRSSENLCSSLGIVSMNNRIKTYLDRSHLRTKLPKPIEIKISSSSDNYDTDHNFDCDDNYDTINNDINDSDDIKLSEISIDDKISEISIEDSNKIDIQKTIVIEKVFSEDESLVQPNEDEKLLIEDLKITKVDIIPEVITIKKKKDKKRKKHIKEKDSKHRFKKNTDGKKNDLDPKNWLKYNLSEEEALSEFKARGEHRRYLSAEFKCTDCLKGFSKEDMLNRHIKLRHNELVGPIECRFCRMRFKWKCELTKHMRQHYTKYKCLRCDLVCPLETTALFHDDYHNGVTRKCKHCGEEFKHLTTYYTHLRTHRSEHVCTLCGASFVSATGLRIHKKIKHLNENSEIPQGEEKYCERCDINFESKNAYEEHLIHSAKHVDGIEDLEIQNVKPSSNTRKRMLKVKRMTRIPTDCHLCGKHFETQAACRKHHLVQHPGTSFFAPNERHICEICGISLVPSSVSSHLNTHTREKLYSCTTCGRAFNSKSGLNSHQLTHSTVKPVACTLCDKRFKQSSSMQLHYRTFHLKEPYPKRNRKKKGDDLNKLNEYGKEESDDNNIPLDRWL